MPKVVSSQTFESLRRVAAVCRCGSDVMAGTLTGEEYGADTARIRERWPDVTARDLFVASIAIAFCIAALDGALPKLSNGGYCSSLFMTEHENLKAHGLGGGVDVEI